MKFLILFFISLSLYAQTAIIIVSPQGDSTYSNMKEQQYNADLLKSSGWTVHEFYTPKDNWRKIKKVCKSNKIDLFIYSGHTEAYWYYNQPLVMQLTKKNINQSTFNSEILLDSSTLVFYANCNYAAGTASKDTCDIGWEEAIRRVKRFSTTFDNTTYLANNGDSNFILAKLLKGVSMEDVYFYLDNNDRQSWKYYYSYRHDKKLIINKTIETYWFYKSEYYVYNSAYFGELNFKLKR